MLLYIYIFSTIYIAAKLSNELTRVTLFYLCVAGGAISNLYGMLLARYKAFPSIKTSGFPSGVQLVVFTSEHVCIENKYWNRNV